MPLSVGDVYVEDDDLALLPAGRWWNDSVLALCYEWLEQELQPAKTGIWLMQASLAHLLKFLVDEAEQQALLAGGPVPNCDHCFIPWSDSRSPDANSGTHWTLLHYDVGAGQVFVYDSLCGPVEGERPALPCSYAITSALARLQQRPEPQVYRGSSPLQRNGSDCGPLVVHNTARLLCGLLGVPFDRQPTAERAYWQVRLVVHRDHCRMLGVLEKRQGGKD
ncbi:uncharacterized protein MONBRDRAFT_6304 [Monosiga brevicollis MX1]|uniref:Ubiquitin-like protease family profile domain-containing protein n=1 Tax=Monosiga brevicollis TaxID=81824 RepID=A9UTF6_MONBE|nr:uncharacterized protein MONBRDRAFT_6304 [Monosiga brevicollis MX1]EDQ91484.1 predicted protein [Monosiga brevicollis MX1]|eukprot:XP_001743906.1 hypothetical protein [Monosiga brevicollis MX1]